MPNICNYSMRVKGQEENIITLYNWLRSNYNYNENNKGMTCWIDEEDGTKIPSEHHIGYKVFECYPSNGEIVDEDGVATFDGECAWSVRSCMFDKGLGIYMEERKAISIDEASRILGLEIEIFSEEPGMCFSEHYYINKGEIICAEDTEFTEYWLEYYDKNSSEFNEEEYNKLEEDRKKLIDTAIENGEGVVTICNYLDSYGFWMWQYF